MPSHYIERDISTHLLNIAKMYPVITICGPRQSGKTTIARHLFPHYDYVSMEDPFQRQQYESDPREFLRQHHAPCIFDEVQNTPDLLSYLQGIVDEENRPGMYIVTGSRQMELQQTITQSLAGRTGVIDLLPLSYHELQRAGIKLSRNEALFYGGLPRLHAAANISASTIYADYLRTYVERDVRQILNIRNIREFDTCIRLLASRVGQVINYSSLANDVGVSAPTIREWLSLLEASYIIFTLHPYYHNWGKRLTKASKIYFTETGLVAALLNIHTPEQLGRDPLIGNIFENFVVSEFLKTRFNAGLRSNFYFYRDAHGFEIDLLADFQRHVRPIEIKSSTTYSPALTQNLRKFKEATSTPYAPILIYGGESLGSPQGVLVRSFADIYNIDLSQEEAF